MKIKCRRRSEIVLSRINLCNDRAMMLKKEKQAILTRTEYLQDPCRTSAIPFWRCFDYELPAGVEVIHEEEIGKIDIDKRRQAVRYFRLFHRLDWMPSCIQSKAELLIAPRQTADFAAMINAAYADLQVSEAQLLQLQKQASFDPKGWLLAKDKQTGLPLACGIAALDRETQEISLEWIQVLPQARWQGIGRDLVIQLLLNLKDQARFATVSGKLDGAHSPEKFYRKCGFTGNDVWYIVRK